MQIWSNVNFYALQGFEEYINSILEDIGKVNIKKEEEKTLGGFIFSFYFTFNLPNVHTLNVVHLFCYLSITYQKMYRVDSF